MDDRTRELVAIGASVTANCQPCLKYHLNKAHHYEVDPKDIEEAIALARMVRKGARAKMDAFIVEEGGSGPETSDTGSGDGCAPRRDCCG